MPRRREHIQIDVSRSAIAYALGVRTQTSIGQVVARGGADVLATDGTMLTRVGRVRAIGVQNPSDEELLALLVAIV